MAKIVIAGRANCPYYAKVELLADKIANSVDSFVVHKIVKTPDEWESWLKAECSARTFAHNKSPIVWRELVDRGGKGILIGGVNEFQEYAWGYYGIKSQLMTTDVKQISVENLVTKETILKELEVFKNQSNPSKICISNAGSPTCYHLINAIASGEIFGLNKELHIKLLCKDIELEQLNGCKMEMIDMACKLLRGVTVTSNEEDAFESCEAVILLDELVREGDEDEESWLKRNCTYFQNKLKVIDNFCKPNVKVLFAGNGPINTSLSMAMEEIKKVDRKNIITMPRLLENQAKAILAQKVKVKSCDVVDVIIWGDNEKYFCDTSYARVHNHDGSIWGPPFYSRLASLLIHEDQWLSKDFLDSLNTRQAVEKEKMKHSPAFSHAAAINTLMKQWLFGSPAEQIISLGIASEGWYGVPEGIVFNFPARILSNGTCEVIKNLTMSEPAAANIKGCINYLLEQKYKLRPELRPTPPPTQVPTGEMNPNTPQPPTMTPIREETDQELRPTGELTEETITSPTHEDQGQNPAADNDDEILQEAPNISAQEHQPVLPDNEENEAI